MISDSMFENIVSPAYYASRLEGPLEIIKSIFRDQMPWGNSAQGNDRMELFLGSEIFSELYFRHIMGVFMSNVLHIRIEAVVVKIKSEIGEKIAVVKCKNEIGLGVQIDEELEGGDIPDIDVGVLGSVLGDLGGDGGAEGVESVEKEVIVKKNYGAGLFHIYSKLNHSCCCNTVNQGGSRAEVSLIATMDIPKGEKNTEQRDTLTPYLSCLYLCLVIIEDWKEF